MFLIKKNIKKEFKELFILLEKTTLRKEDKESAAELLFAGETRLALDTIVSQLYE